MKSPDRDAADELGHCLAYHTDAYGTTFVPRTVIERVIADWSELDALRTRAAELEEQLAASDGLLFDEIYESMDEDTRDALLAEAVARHKARRRSPPGRTS